MKIRIEENKLYINNISKKFKDNFEKFIMQTGIKGFSYKYNGDVEIRCLNEISAEKFKKELNKTYNFNNEAV